MAIRDELMPNLSEQNPVLDLEVFIPSRSRWERSLTLEAIAPAWERVALVVPKEQFKKYQGLAEQHKVRLIGCPHDGIARTREFIGGIARSRFIMLDDDLRFTARHGLDDPRLYLASNRDISGMLILVARLLDLYAHVCIGPRQFNNKYSTAEPPSGAKVEPHKYPGYPLGRPLRALAYRKWPFVKCKHGRVDIMEDFDVTLQLLEQGYQNYIITEYAQDQVQTQLPGGCSDYRTHELHAANVRKLAKLHPKSVKIVEKANKTGGEFGKRIEAMIFWEKTWKRAMEEIL